jgi:hypothetical protein
MEGNHHFVAMFAFCFDDEDAGDPSGAYRSTRAAGSQQAILNRVAIVIPTPKAGGDVIAKCAEICGQWISPG